MKIVNYTQDILPSYFNIKSPELRFRWLIPDFSEVKEGDSIAEFNYYGDKNRTFTLRSVYSGILSQQYCRRIEDPVAHAPKTKLNLNSAEDMLRSLRKSGIDMSALYAAMQGDGSSTPLKNEILYKVYSLEEFQQECPNVFKVNVDDFTDAKTIEWIKVSNLIHPSGTYYYLSNELFVKFRYIEEKPVLSVCYLSTEVPIRSGDIVRLLFDDKKVLGFSLGRSHQPKEMCDTKAFKEVDIELDKEALEIMSSLDLLKVRIEFKNGNPSFPINICSKISPKVMATLFKTYARVFCKALDECGVKWLDESDVISCAASDPCYVYLMVDTANGYHKIGMSNNPEYRERTLQSEKPTIEKVCARQYPSRIIAEAIESALHKAFGEKRLRGEWFDLTQEEVEMLKATLR